MDIHSPWDQRIARARTLATSRPAAAAMLAFYARLAQCQQLLLGADDTPTSLPNRSGSGPAPLLELVAFDRVLDAVPRFLSWLSQIEEQEVEAIDRVRQYGTPRWRTLLRSYVGGMPQTPPEGMADPGTPPDVADPLAAFVLEAVLQPFVEQGVQRSAIRHEADATVPMRCPRCAALPVAAVLREEGLGAGRSLLCALCLTDWECVRIVCPACGHREFDELPVYTAEQFPHVRIDACDGCGHYVKTIDLTKDGLAVPYVDDIASVSLDLWARERGYVRVKRNVLGL